MGSDSQSGWIENREPGLVNWISGRTSSNPSTLITFVPGFESLERTKLIAPVQTEMTLSAKTGANSQKHNRGSNGRGHVTSTQDARRYEAVLPSPS
jgi:hypothetical protein